VEVSVLSSTLRSIWFTINLFLLNVWNVYVFILSEDYLSTSTPPSIQMTETHPSALLSDIIPPYTRKKPNMSAGYIKLKPCKVGYT